MAEVLVALCAQGTRPGPTRRPQPVLPGCGGHARQPGIPLRQRR